MYNKELKGRISKKYKKKLAKAAKGKTAIAACPDRINQHQVKIED